LACRRYFSAFIATGFVDHFNVSHVCFALSDEIRMKDWFFGSFVSENIDKPLDTEFIQEKLWSR
jgi:hypothetical protein